MATLSRLEMRAKEKMAATPQQGKPWLLKSRVALSGDPLVDADCCGRWTYHFDDVGTRRRRDLGRVGIDGSRDVVEREADAAAGEFAQQIAGVVVQSDAERRQAGAQEIHGGADASTHTDTH